MVPTESTQVTQLQPLGLGAGHEARATPTLPKGTHRRCDAGQLPPDGRVPRAAAEAGPPGRSGWLESRGLPSTLLWLAERMVTEAVGVAGGGGH